jgi:hypothetical protein
MMLCLCDMSWLKIKATNLLYLLTMIQWLTEALQYIPWFRNVSSYAACKYNMQFVTRHQHGSFTVWTSKLYTGRMIAVCNLYLGTRIRPDLPMDTVVALLTIRDLVWVKQTAYLQSPCRDSLACGVFVRCQNWRMNIFNLGLFLHSDDFE